MSDLHDALVALDERPAPFSTSTVDVLWNDPHVSARMLAFHLDPEANAASRPAATVQGTLRWLHQELGAGPGTRVLDLGCGPGLHAVPLAQGGAHVRGVDLSERSVAHARHVAAERGTAVDLVVGDYLTADLGGPHDLALLIMCDLCVLSPERLGALLDRLAEVLVPGGRFAFDAYGPAALDAREESATYGVDLMGGFWSAQPYVGFRRTFLDRDAGVGVDRYLIVEEGRMWSVDNWLRYVPPEALAAELEAHGFAVDRLVGDLTGGPFDPAAPEYGVVAVRVG